MLPQRAAKLVSAQYETCKISIYGRSICLGPRYIPQRIFFVPSDATHKGLENKDFRGLAIEPKKWPDAPTNPSFLSILIRTGQVHRQN